MTALSFTKGRNKKDSGKAFYCQRHGIPSQPTHFRHLPDGVPSLAALSSQGLPEVSVLQCSYPSILQLQIGPWSCLSSWVYDHENPPLLCIFPTARPLRKSAGSHPQESMHTRTRPRMLNSVFYPTNEVNLRFVRRFR